MYKYEVTVNEDADHVYGKLSQLLKSKGYVILSYVDMGEILKKTLQKEIGEYYILNICKPQAASEFLDVSMDMGLFLPCKITIRKHQSGSKVVFQLLTSQVKEFMNFDLVQAQKYEKEISDVLDQL